MYLTLQSYFCSLSRYLYALQIMRFNRMTSQEHQEDLIPKNSE